MPLNKETKPYTSTYMYTHTHMHAYTNTHTRTHTHIYDYILYTCILISSPWIHLAFQIKFIIRILGGSRVEVHEDEETDNSLEYKQECLAGFIGPTPMAPKIETLHGSDFTGSHKYIGKRDLAPRSSHHEWKYAFIMMLARWELGSSSDVMANELHCDIVVSTFKH